MLKESLKSGLRLCAYTVISYPKFLKFEIDVLYLLINYKIMLVVSSVQSNALVAINKKWRNYSLFLVLVLEKINHFVLNLLGSNLHLEISLTPTQTSTLVEIL